MYLLIGNVSLEWGAGGRRPAGPIQGQGQNGVRPRYPGSEARGIPSKKQIKSERSIRISVPKFPGLRTVSGALLHSLISRKCDARTQPGVIAQFRRCYDLALTAANSNLTQNLTRTCTVQDTGLEGITDALQTGIQDCASP